MAKKSVNRFMTSQGKKLTGRKKLVFQLVYFPFLVILICSVVEISARVIGYRPWTVTYADIKIEPGGRFYQTHPKLGYKHLPGEFRVTLAGNYSFKTTNQPNTLRVTHPSASGTSANPALWVFGDSITYGWSVNDEETYAWLLQQKLPDREVVNFGVNGYGTLQSLIQLREALERERPPKMVILAYASWHDVRNTFIRMRRKMLAPAAVLGPVNQPYAHLDGSGDLHISMDAIEFREFPLMRHSAFIHALEQRYDLYEERHSQSQEVTKAIIKEMSDLCKSKGITFAIAALTSDPSTTQILEFGKSLGIQVGTIWVDFLDLKENNNLPFDSHPSAIAHKQYAEKLLGLLAPEN